MQRTILLPAVFLGCLLVVWIGTVAATNTPSQPADSSGLSATAVLSQSDETDSTSQAQLCSLSDRYPAEIHQWCDLIESSASDHNLPPSLIAAVMLQESGGNPLSYSSSGAVGLMQIMPSDGIAVKFMCINGPCFASRPSRAELEDPAFNVSFGAEILSDLHQRYGSYREALFHYGPIDIDYHYADIVLSIWENYQ
jgi:soluble lytic murein transglycosylase-like protein